MDASLGIVEQHLGITHDEIVVQADIVAVCPATCIGTADNLLECEPERVAIESLNGVLDTDFSACFLLLQSHIIDGSVSIFHTIDSIVDMLESGIETV